MSKVIYKYHLTMTDTQIITMPVGAEVLHAEVKDGQMNLWALVDPHFSDWDYMVRVIGTGNPIDDIGSFRYVSTIVLNFFVWHVFIK